MLLFKIRLYILYKIKSVHVVYQICFLSLFRLITVTLNDSSGFVLHQLLVFVFSFLYPFPLPYHPLQLMLCKVHKPILRSISLLLLEVSTSSFGNKSIISSKDYVLEYIISKDIRYLSHCSWHESTSQGRECSEVLWILTVLSSSSIL